MQDQALYEIVRSTIGDLGYVCLEVVLLRAKNKHTLKVVLYHSERSVGSEDCSEVAEILSRRLDIDDPIDKRYDLIVESPGLEREIKNPSEYPYFLGKEFKIFPQDLDMFPCKEGFFIAVLKNHEGDLCTFDLKGQIIEMPISAIRKVRLHYDFQNALKKRRQE